MGRIQRKKSSATKKKKKQATAKQPAAGVKDAIKPGAKSVALGEGSAKASIKKKALSPKRQAAAPLPATKPKDNIFTKAAQFLREVKVELKKVAWPSRKQTIGSTAVVIALVMIISIFLGVVDFGISSLIRIVLQ
jgi:preprotein translocase subunit SecE